MNLSTESEAIFTFHNRREETSELGILLEGNMTELPFQQINNYFLLYNTFKVWLFHVHQNCEQE